MVLVSHFSGWSHFKFLFNQTWDSWIGHVFFWDLGSIGIIVFICISGAVLELNKKFITTITDYATYMARRVLRIYPAYWMSLLFVIAIFLYSHKSNFGNIFWQFSGFSAFTLHWGGELNPAGWCIGLFVVLYLLFPFISKLMEERPGLVLAVLFVLSMLTTWWINTILENNPSDIALSMARWFPLCSLFYFGMGIYIVRKGYYPEWEDTTGIISWLGELSFYVFLFQSPVRTVYMQNGIFLYLAVLGLVSFTAMMIDKKIQVKLLSFIKNFFKIIPEYDEKKPEEKKGFLNN